MVLHSRNFGRPTRKHVTPIRAAPKAIIIERGKVLALKMRDDEGSWYLLPGGGADFGETLHDALRREVMEEVGVEIDIGPLFFVRDYIGVNHEFADEDPDAHQIEYMFECRIVGDGKLGTGIEPDKGQLGVEWLPVDLLEEYRLYPKAVRPIIRHMHDDAGPVYMGDVN